MPDNDARRCSIVDDMFGANQTTVISLLRLGITQIGYSYKTFALGGSLVACVVVGSHDHVDGVVVALRRGGRRMGPWKDGFGRRWGFRRQVRDCAAFHHPAKH